MRARGLTTGLIVAVAIAISSVPAGAEGAATGGADVEDGTPVAEVRTGGSRPGESASAGRGAAPVCAYTALPEDAVVYEPDGTEVVQSAPGRWYTVACDGQPPPGGVSYVFISTVDPAVLAEQAKRALPLTAPDVQTSPSAEDDQLVGVPTWLWVGDAWAPLTATASLPGVSVTVTATPESVVWDMGNGDRVVCRGGGTAYDPNRPDGEQSTDCSYTYDRASGHQPGERYRVTATMTWQVSWTVSGAAGGGSLGALSRSTAFGLRVTEAQALNT